MTQASNLDYEMKKLKEYRQDAIDRDNDPWYMERLTMQTSLVLGMLMEENKDVFIRLKERGD
jgi:hypothetical protein